MRLIDVDALRQSIESKIYWEQINNVACLEAIDDAPTVDAVPVVRCKDCKHFYHSISSDRDGRCVQFGTYDTDPSVYLNDFCSYGERRTDNA